ncbi:hypothetical protein IW261DRAFT_1419599 [Armillaria novae-zelandiae]|uniref:Uncharacterized protein n=1 Tax=Armillaria novae-zelandiae TaxID=153914 RepID=A0AA39P8D5_9AGAR|nr:hypothetical protein IW261DRAFT_1419599 [Armillaria novae-zelandiae]
MPSNKLESFQRVPTVLPSSNVTTPTPPSAHQMPTNGEGECLVSMAIHLLSALADFKSSATQEDIDKRYPPIVAPRKKTKRQIEATQKCDGETMEEYEKHLQRAKLKQQQRAAVKPQLLVHLKRNILKPDLLLHQNQTLRDDINILQDQAQAVHRHAEELPILKDTNEHIIFMCAPFPPDAQLNNIIMDHLVHHRGVKLEGFYMPEIVERLMTEYMATQWNIQPARVVEVHGAPPPFGLMDNGYDAWNNTSSQYDWPHGLLREQWSDMNWGLLHHASTYMDEYHDADGKMTLIIGEQGISPWFCCQEIFNPATYMPSHACAYGVMIWVDGPNPEQQDFIEEQESEALKQVKKCPWAPEAV